MRNLFDNHSHSNFSFDGMKTSIQASTESAAARGLGGICFTDHCDFFIPSAKINEKQELDEVFDIKAQQEEIDRVQGQFRDGFKVLLDMTVEFELLPEKISLIYMLYGDLPQVVEKIILPQVMKARALPPPELM
mgnify:CR=1 FL=1